MNQRDGLSNENRRAFRRQAICSVYPIKGRIPTIHLLAEQLFWLHWMNIFTTRAQRHQDVVIAAARPRRLKNPWLARPRTSCLPVAAVAPLFPPLPPVQISKIEYLFQAALCLCALVVKPVTAAAHPFPPCFKIDLCALIIAH